MNANELRINNLVEIGIDIDLKPVYGVIKAIDNEKACVLYNQLDMVILLSYIKPIPLTEEWLLKFGFEKEKTGSFIKSFHDEEFLLENYGSINGSEKGYVANNDFRFKRIQYIHQLQNLYFATTEEELSEN